MTWEVVVFSKAQTQLIDSAAWWAENRSPRQAALWLDGIQAAIEKLAINARIYGIAKESEQFPFEVRQLLFGLGHRATHRVVYAIEDYRVLVFAVRHVAQTEIGLEAFEE